MYCQVISLLPRPLKEHCQHYLLSKQDNLAITKASSWPPALLASASLFEHGLPVTRHSITTLDISHICPLDILNFIYSWKPFLPKPSSLKHKKWRTPARNQNALKLILGHAGIVIFHEEYLTTCLPPILPTGCDE